jgi:hypothetical protein
VSSGAFAGRRDPCLAESDFGNEVPEQVALGRREIPSLIYSRIRSA